ncbi:MAG: Mur ligase family protein [Candidatus Levybacteria bacterium]|nr:Mur ligase family protein [Candidatus Levybacteria bacterium]
MLNSLIIFLGKCISLVSRMLNLGSGSTWPGHIALNANKNFIKDVLKNNGRKLKIILVAGTNGKTTTTKLIRSILQENGKKIFENTSGANLLNGIASALISNADIDGQIDKDFAIFEIDENTLSLILKEITNPDFVIILNLFRDQLDRYGEVNAVSKRWADALKKLDEKTTLILNADDPQVASLRLHLEGVNVKFFGLNDMNLATAKAQHAADSTYCPNCEFKLSYSAIYYSHLGAWACLKCGNSRPKLNISTSSVFPLLGIYNRYNTIAAILLAQEVGINKNNIISALKDFQPAFGRQETLDINGKKVQIFLSKNPTSLNESLKTISDLKAENLLLVLNDRIPDGRDVSWIWDVDFEEIVSKFKNITISGDRAYDMGLRIKYAQSIIHDSLFIIQEDLEKAIAMSLEKTPKSETLYILPTYSAMLEVRKILTGKKIL